MKDFQESLANKYNYKPLPAKISKDIRMKYYREIPRNLKMDGEKAVLYDNNNNIICHYYDRIVIGDYGAFIEFSIESIDSESYYKNWICVDNYRSNVSHNSKYIHWELKDSKCKIYEQKSCVNYADYIPGKYYVSVHDVK